MGKQLKFPQDVEDFIHELCARAILRAQQEGTFVPPGKVDLDETKSMYPFDPYSGQHQE
jgi:hypothetical protein